ncbi:MAG TPA: flagellar protein FlgN [bacterium]|nr:flagellar protein FlgN [bacterium]
MDKQYQELISILQKELAVFQELRDLLNAETKPLIEFDAQSLEKITKAKQTLELRLKILEQARLDLLVALIRRFNIQPEKATLKELARFAPEPQAQILLKTRDTFKRLTGEMRKKVDGNSQLAESSLRLLQGLRGLIQRTIEEPTTYEGAGQVKARRDSIKVAGRRV